MRRVAACILCPPRITKGRGGRVMDALQPSFVRPQRPPAGRDAPLSVGVTVDLELGNGAGGHVKCWQRVAGVFAGAVAEAEFGDVDLTVYFLGDEARTIALGERARMRFVPPGRGTGGLGLGNAPGHTDLARRNPAIEPMLARHDVLHTTGPFALSGSAAW